MAIRFVPLLAAGSLALAACASQEEDEGPATADEEVAVEADQSIAESLARSEALSGFATLVASAGLTEAMGGIGPYTVFAPTNSAVESLGDVAQMPMPERAALVSYHIVPGLVTSADLANAIETAGGSVELATMTGATLTVARDGDSLVVRDGRGNDTAVTQADFPQQNGVIHVVDEVLSPG